MIDTIIDIFHANNVEPAAAKAAGVVAIIHKASEGLGFKDDKYQERRDAAKKLGLLWGAYHLSSGEDPKQQVAEFIKAIGTVDDSTLLALDWEKSKGHGKATLEQTHAFVIEFRKQTGRYPVLYGGDSVREGVGDKRDELLANCPLWYIRLKPTPSDIPTATWATYTLWQYSDGKKKDEAIPPPTYDLGGADWNRFNGSIDELKEKWPFISA